MAGLTPTPISTAAMLGALSGTPALTMDTDQANDQKALQAQQGTQPGAPMPTLGQPGSTPTSGALTPDLIARVLAEMAAKKQQTLEQSAPGMSYDQGADLQNTLRKSRSQQGPQVN